MPRLRRCLVSPLRRPFGQSLGKSRKTFNSEHHFCSRSISKRTKMKRIRITVALGILTSIALIFAFPRNRTSGQETPPAYRNPSLPIETRVNDLVSRMTLEEKVSQMMNGSAAVERLGIPAYEWWNEALHGVARAGYATVFPQAIGLAATWDTDLMH